MIIGRHIRNNLFRKQILLTSQNRFFSSANSKQIKDLRQATGSPIKDCIKVLEETSGDIEKAKELLRQRGLADADKKIGRDATQGLVSIKIDKT